MLPETDGIYTEFGNNGNALNASALLCKPLPQFRNIPQLLQNARVEPT